MLHLHLLSTGDTVSSSSGTEDLIIKADYSVHRIYNAVILSLCLPDAYHWCCECLLLLTAHRVESLSPGTEALLTKADLIVQRI